MINRSAHAAAVWSFVFAALSFYWALGGTVGAETLGSAFTDNALMDDPLFVAFLWLTAVLKVGLGLLALALVQSWGRGLPRRFLQIVAWGVGILLTLYGAALFIEHGLIASGVRDIPQAIGSMSAVYWHLFVWDPYWFLGGILFLAAARVSKCTQLQEGSKEVAKDKIRSSK